MTNDPELLSCTRYNPEIFFDENHEALAISICALCPSREECRNGAIERHESDGVWGGITAKVRRALRVKRRRRYCPACSSVLLRMLNTPERHQTCQHCGLSWATQAPPRDAAR